MKRLVYLISTFLILTGMYGGNVGAESWQDRAARKAAWSADFPDDPACWDTENPWIVGVGSHFLFEDLVDCFRVCAKNNTCYQAGWMDEDAASATCTSSSSDSLRNILRGDGTSLFLGPSQYARSPCK